MHDLPHRSAVTEWWYLHAHVQTADGRDLSVFASFFRVATGQDEDTKETIRAHSMTWALSDPQAKRYYSDGLVDPDAPRLGLDKLERGEGAKDPRVRRALREMLEGGQVPYPDHLFESAPFVHDKKLEIDFDGNRLSKNDAGEYTLHLYHRYHHCGVTLTFTPQRAPIRHGEDGVVRGHDGADMFYYFIPRCDVRGEVVMNGIPVAVTAGSGWYDHEFGGHRDADQEVNENVAWNWLGAQLDDGTDVSAYTMVDEETGESMGRRAVIVSPDGTVESYEDVRFVAAGDWSSTRTFNTYPTRFRVDVPEAGLSLDIHAAFDDQEFVTLISKPAFWEGRCSVTGDRHGVSMTGRAYVERSGFFLVKTLDEFFRAVGRRVRGSVAGLLPMDPSYEQVRDLIASEERAHYMEGVDLEEFVKTGVVPVRDITDRGGKGWRSYAALACCDVVGGDSRNYVHWLAMPELMHVGSLIVDDVQDRSTVRRGGPTCHMIHGDAIAINAGTSCYFMGQHLIQGTEVSNADKLRLYDLYFEALRAGHAGQAADIKGLDEHMPRAVETGESEGLEVRVLAIHRLKTAAPAGSLARMGAVVGGASEAQIEGLGRYFEDLGVAFQLIDDVLNLRGFERGLKDRGEDIAHGKVTMPIAKAMSRLPADERARIWAVVQSKPSDQSVIDAAIETLEACGAVQACHSDAEALIENAWKAVDPLLEPSIVKLMLRAFGWYVLQRHY